MNMNYDMFMGDPEIIGLWVKPTSLRTKDEQPDSIFMGLIFLCRQLETGLMVSGSLVKEGELFKSGHWHTGDWMFLQSRGLHALECTHLTSPITLP